MQAQKKERQIDARKHPATPFDYFTGGKTADFAIYFNMAQDNINELIADLEGNNTKNVTDIKKDETFIALRNFLWKGFEFNKNTSGYSITEDDKRLIKKLCTKLNELRNFHSHVWHDNAVLEFDEELQVFTEDKLKVAVAEAMLNFTDANIKFFEEQLSKMPHFDKRHFITQEGRCFFLSFFLTKGQMNSFLQRRKGTKRNDMPEYKVKRNIYTWYCHNDGASITGHHINETAFDQLNKTEKKEILKARQAYKIISYLNDIPEILSDTSAIPLFNKKNEDIIKCSSIQDLVFFLKENQVFAQLEFREIDINNLEKNDRENTKRNGAIDFYHTEIHGYTFRVSQTHLHKIIIQRILRGKDFEELFLNKLKAFAADRKKLFNFLLQQYHNPVANEQVVMSEEDLKAWSIKADTKLMNAFKQWLDGWLKEHNVNVQATWNLINKLRSSQFPAITQLSQLRFTNWPSHDPASPEPIVLLSQYFFMGEENFIEEMTEKMAIPKSRLQQKSRPGNQFVQFAVKFLIDNEIVPRWKWQLETFVTENKRSETGEMKAVNKKIKKYSADIDEGYRLSIVNNQVLVALQKENTIGNNKNDYWVFGLGPNTLRYLLTYYVLAENTNKLQGFLSQLKGDMEKLVAFATEAENATPTYSLLDDRYIPSYYQNLKRATGGAGITTSQNGQLLTGLKEQVQQRVNFIIRELENARDAKHKLRRADKNRLIMRCYNYFDWTITVDKKFLRQGEYNQMSVCHYLLSDRPKFWHMYEKSFKLRSRVPVEVNELLSQSASLDELMENVIAKTTTWLKFKTQNIIDITVSKVLKQELVPFARTIGLPVPDNLLSQIDFDALGKKRKETMNFLPFDIHPNLVLKFFYKEKFMEGYFKYNSLYKELQTDKRKKGLITSHYAVDNLVALYKPFEGLPAKENAAGKKNEAVLAMQKLRGNISICHTEDILLLEMARKYLGSSNYTSPFAKAIIDCLADDANIVTVKNLHTEPVIMKVDKKKDESTRYVHLRLHQLDDLLFRTNQQKLYDAITHYCKRQQEEGNKYKEPLTRDSAIELDEVYREIRRVQQDGQVLGGSLLEWEMLVIMQYSIIKMIK